MPLKNMLLGAFLLGLFAIAGTSLVAFTYDATAERIAENERQALLSSLHQLVPPDRHDNDLFADFTYVSDPLLGTSRPVPVYRARRNDEPVAAVLTPFADGYGGSIRLLVAINVDGTLAGVRVLRHQETPGLGDKIEAERSDWILQFQGLSLEHPQPSGWAVKKNGGVFDQFTGATITPRAIVNAVRNSLVFFRDNRERLFEQDRVAPTDEQKEDQEHG
ncbi:electron transport complex subunit RsxG [Thiohalomonas denitrificans]|uniref:Ion-translocating oxidoreductase complex subunit G n=1 Tax=Thiohalomonas denitrificans TaxID=415747 RepID=A0A1G5QML5_9GAMM|nr:electron transport complex subunit RsxG [Thiohalomonas denitrificans]SCZ62800.1 electron transport complex protein RnfG [Thiohalomonas denitrificans]